MKIKLIGEDGNEVADGEEGELVATSDNIMLGFCKDIKETSIVLINIGYHTGDVGYRDRDGFYYVLRRKDDF